MSFSWDGRRGPAEGFQRSVPVSSFFSSADGWNMAKLTWYLDMPCFFAVGGGCVRRFVYTRAPNDRGVVVGGERGAQIEGKKGAAAGHLQSISLSLCQSHVGLLDSRAQEPSVVRYGKCDVWVKEPALTRQNNSRSFLSVWFVGYARTVWAQNNKGGAVKYVIIWILKYREKLIPVKSIYRHISVDIQYYGYCGFVSWKSDVTIHCANSYFTVYIVYIQKKFFYKV